MNANLGIMKGAALLATLVGLSAAAAACSGDDNSSPTNTNQQDASMSGSDSGNSNPNNGNDAGNNNPDGGGTPAALCVDASIGTPNQCSPWGCAGFYDDTKAGIPATLPASKGP